jgi:predicted AlkP superfamily phosphohydrolase/phosphomutase
MVSRLTQEAYEGLTYPENLYPEILPLIQLPKPDQAISYEERYLDEISGELRTLENIGVHLLKSQPSDAFIFYIQTTDKIMHKFWQYKQPQKFKGKGWNLDKSKIKKFGGAIDDHWCQLDTILGKILQKTDDRTNIVIVSDHGAKARAKPFMYVDGNKLLETLGFLKFKDKSGDIDFTQTKVYSSDPTIWNTHYSFSLNVKGREENGVIDEEAFETEQEKIVHQLRSIRTKKKNRLFGAVYSVKENGIDIIAEQTSILRQSSGEILIMNGQEIPLKNLLTRVEGDSGNHDPRGMVIMAGPAFGKQIISRQVVEFAFSFVLSYLQGLSQNKMAHRFFEVMKRVKFIDHYTTLDIMPTLLAIMKLPSTDYMPGKIMMKLLSNECKKTLNYYKAKKYDISIPAVFREDMEDREDEKIKDQLRGLGYLG